MKMRISLASALFTIALLSSTQAGFATTTTIGFALPLPSPKMESLDSTFAITGGTVVLVLALGYDETGNLKCLPGSTVDGAAAACTGKQTTTYLLKVTVPGTTITLSGAIGGTTAKANYKNGKRKLLSPTVNVSQVVTDPPIPGQVVLSWQADAKGNITGTGHIVSGYGNDPAGDGTLKGKIVKTKVSWSFTQGKRKLTFSGTQSGSTEWVGKITAVVPPAKMSGTATISLLPIQPPAGPAAQFHGSVQQNDGMSSEAASGVTVTIRSDVNGDGTITDAETVTTTTDSKGAFDAQFNVVEGRQVMIDFDKSGYSKTPKVFASVTPGSDVLVNTTLRQLDPLTINTSLGKADSKDGKLQLENLPPSVNSMNGRVFNPATESAQFPGAFADDSGKILVSSVFSAVEATDTSGSRVTTLTTLSDDTKTKLRMQVPPETWNTMKDLTPGNGKIDVPLYYYDDADGKWKRSTSDGWLEDEASATLPESALGSIQDGTYSGKLYAAGNITHLSYWNIDWPVETHGCVTGRIVDAHENPVSGAVLTAHGITYTGTSSPRTTDSTGSFCIEVMKGSQISIGVYANGKHYQIGPITVPDNPATCAQGNCLDLGSVPLDAGHEVVVTLCEITGTVVYSGTSNGGDPGIQPNAPIDGAMVFANDPDTQQELEDCYLNPQGCVPFSTTDASGHFVLKIPVLLSADVDTVKFVTAGSSYTTLWFMGLTNTQGCPSAPVTIKADAYMFTLFSALLKDGSGTTVGALYVVNEQGGCYFTSGQNFYVCSADTKVQIPTGTGAWFTANVFDQNRNAAGTVQFSVGNATPGQMTGTWTATVGPSGTWNEGLAAAAGDGKLASPADLLKIVQPKP